MSKYVNREDGELVVDAFRWGGGASHQKYPEWFERMLSTGQASFISRDENGVPSRIQIPVTPGYGFFAYAGDYIVEGGGIQNVYVYSAEDFEKKYMPLPYPKEVDAAREIEAWRKEVDVRDARIRELENEVAFLKGKIEGMRSVPLPVQPVYGEKLPYTGNPVKAPYEVTCINGANTTGVKQNPHSFIGPEREITSV